MAWDFQETLDYYRSQGAPRDQQALVQLLKEVQQHFGSLPGELLEAIAAAYGISESYLLAIVRRFPSLKLSGELVLELCAGPNCGKHTALAAYAETLEGVTVKYVPCMRMCGKGPNLRLKGKLYHGADEALLRSLLGR